MFNQPRYNPLSFKTHIHQSQPPSLTLHPLIFIYTSHYSSLHHPFCFSPSSPHWFDSQIVFVLEGAKMSVQAACIHFPQSKSLHYDFIFTVFLFFFFFVKVLSAWQVDWLDKTRKKQREKRQTWHEGSLVCASVCVLMSLRNDLWRGSMFGAFKYKCHRLWEKLTLVLSLYALSLSPPNTGWWKWHMPIRMAHEGTKVCVYVRAGHYSPCCLCWCGENVEKIGNTFGIVCDPWSALLQLQLHQSDGRLWPLTGGE